MFPSVYYSILRISPEISELIKDVICYLFNAKLVQNVRLEFNEKPSNENATYKYDVLM